MCGFIGSGAIVYGIGFVLGSVYRAPSRNTGECTLRILPGSLGFTGLDGVSQTFGVWGWRAVGTGVCLAVWVCGPF